MMRTLKMLRVWVSVLALFVDVLLLAPSANAALRKDGAWPAGEKAVTFNYSGASREDAVKSLADAAGWSVVLQTKLEIDAGPIDIHVKNQPAGKVLDLILGSGNYVATRDDTLISIARDTKAPPSVTPIAPVAPIASVAPIAPITPITPVTPVTPITPAPAEAHAKKSHGHHGKGEDRVITGSSLTIAKGETVHDVVVFGGMVDVYGTVTGDIAVTGGSAHIRPGARVEGDATAMGGSVIIDEGADVEGEVAAMGGGVQRGDHVSVGVVHNDGKGDDARSDDDNDDEDARPTKQHKISRFVQGVGSALTRAAVLFIFGAVLLALGSKRMEALRVEVAARPMRSFAVGLVGTIALVVLVVVLCVTIIGVPVVLLALPLIVFAGYAGLVAALSTAGEGLLRHRTQNPYVHLAVGCGLFVLIGALPYIGTLLALFAALVGIGVVIATRGAGLLPERKKASSGTFAPTV